MIKCELLANHDCKAFDCEDEALNRFLKQYAKQQGKRNLSKTYVLIDDENPKIILGFYCLSALHVTPDIVPLDGFPKQMDIPAMLIGRLAVDKTMKGKGYSKFLIAHALLNVKRVAEIAGIALVVVDAKNEQLIPFYEKLGFVQSSSGLRLFASVSKL